MACTRPDHDDLPTDFARQYSAAMAQLAEVFRSLREDAAVTQEELAEKAGLSVRTISDIERGLRKRLYRDTAERLGVALGLADEALAEFVELARGRAASQLDLTAEFRRRFVAWHVDRVGSLAGQIGNEDEWYAVLDADEANLAVALRWAHEAGDTESLLRLANSLFMYWQARGDMAIGREWFERGLRPETPTNPQLRMTALWGLAWLAYHQGDDACASECARELSELAERHSDAYGRRNAATVVGIVALSRDDIPSAVRALDEALDLARTIDQSWILATSLLNLGIAKIAAKDTVEARNLIGEALRDYTELGDERFRARCLGYQGLAELVDGNPQRGEALYTQSLEAFAALNESKGIAEALTGLATAAAIDGKPTRAAQLAGAAERLRETFAGRAFPVERRLAEAEVARIQAEVADQTWREAWTAGRALRGVDAVAMALTLSAPDDLAVSP